MVSIHVGDQVGISNLIANEPCFSSYMNWYYISTGDTVLNDGNVLKKKSKLIADS